MDNNLPDWKSVSKLSTDDLIEFVESIGMSANVRLPKHSLMFRTVLIQRYRMFIAGITPYNREYRIVKAVSNLTESEYKKLLHTLEGM
jgi:hypothetical protein